MGVLSNIISSLAGSLDPDYRALRNANKALKQQIEMEFEFASRRSRSFSLDEKSRIEMKKKSLSLISAAFADYDGGIPGHVKDEVRARDGNVCVRCRQEEGKLFVRLSGDSALEFNVAIYCYNCKRDRHKRAVMQAKRYA